MSVVSTRSDAVPEYLARTWMDRSVETIPERDPKYQLPICNPASVTEPLEKERTSWPCASCCERPSKDGP